MKILKDKVVAAVVTYNRLELLKKVIAGLRNQTKKPDLILVVNNSSTDGSLEWLKNQSDIEVLTQENLGSSGGQFTSFQACFDRGFEWIWIMDDDVVPRENCLKELFELRSEKKVFAPLRYTPENIPFENDTIKFNLINPFASFWTRIISKDDLKQDIVLADGITFEGPFFHRSLIEKIGLPEKKFFIFADDTEFFIRAKKAGYDMYVSTVAKMDRLLEAPALENNFTWKHYYIIRNIMACDVMHGSFFVRIIRPLIYLVKWYLRANNKEDRLEVIKAFKDGYFYKSSN